MAGFLIYVETRFYTVNRFLCVLCFCLFASLPASGAPPQAALQPDELMDKAIRFLSVLTGREIEASDAAWLREQWNKDIAEEAQTNLAELDQAALNLELIERGDDPRTLASLRSDIITNAYCAAERTSDPVTHRFRTIIAPDDIVLASDCVMDFVVTTFDIEGLMASNALAALITGKEYDQRADEKALKASIADEFPKYNDRQRSFAAYGDIRSAILRKFWNLLGKEQSQALTAELSRQADQSEQIADVARNLEDLAQQKIGAFDFVAISGNFKLTGADIKDYLEWTQRIAGYEFSRRDTSWIRAMLAKAFLSDPQGLQQGITQMDDANRHYILEHDPNRKAAMLNSWAARFYCLLSVSSEPDEKYLLEILFRDDPVVQNDCALKTVTRKSETVIAEANGKSLREREIRDVMVFLGLLLGRAPNEEELAFLRNQEIQEFKKDPAQWQTNYETILSTLQKDRNDNAYLKHDHRLNVFARAYCTFKKSSDYALKKYFEMLRSTYTILFEDCDRTVVVTKRAAKALITEMNFLAWLAGRPPFTQAEEAEILKSWTEAYRTAKTEFPNIKAEAGLAVLRQWWSLLDTAKRREALAEIRNENIKNANDTLKLLSKYVNKASLQVVLINAKRLACDLQAVKLQGEVGLYAAEPGFSTNRFGNILTQSTLFRNFCL